MGAVRTLSSPPLFGTWAHTLDLAFGEALVSRDGLEEKLPLSVTVVQRAIWDSGAPSGSTGLSSETRNRLAEVERLLSGVKHASDFEAISLHRSELEAVMAREGFWNNSEKAQTTIGELKRIKAIVDDITGLESAREEAEMLLELAVEESDKSSLEEVEAESKRLLHAAEQLELRTLLAGPYDAASCYLSIHPGAGGTESCDWAEMLCRMYLRWGERNGYKTRILEQLPAEEAGLKSVTVQFDGDWAYGYLRAEIGVHRLVRLSPFDAKNRRHTSFASVHVSPEVDENVEIEIREADLRVDTYRASGAGGQHVNVTDSAIRITHQPTGIVVQCQNERSQHANRNQAMKVLKSRLIQREQEKRDSEIASMAGEKRDIDFGHQIRSYVLHPYRMAKDHRTSLETGNVDAVLDGDLDDFIEAFLRSDARGRARPGGGTEGHGGGAPAAKEPG